MKLNIFFASNIERIEFLNKQLNIKQINNIDNQVLLSEIDGLDSLKFKSNFGKIPGYWIEVAFSKTKNGKELYARLINVVPADKRNNNVFYPITNNLSLRELHIGWTSKYNFSIKDSCKDKWNLFFKELKTHMKHERMDIVFSGLNLALKYNPFFLKKYKRYYLFEELAYYYEEEGNLTKAIKCLRLQGMLNPKSIEPYLNMSSFYIINGLEEDAIQVCKEGLKKSPQDQYLISNLIIALSNIGNHSFALVFLRKALENDNKNKLLWKLMGNIYYEIDNNKDAIKCYKMALSIKQDNNDDDMPGFYAELYSAIGACYFEEEKYDDAVKYYKKVLIYNSNDTYTLLSLSQIYFYYLEDMEIAFKYTKLLVDQVPDSGFGQYQLGLIYFDQGNFEKSRWHLYKARRLMPNYGPVHDAIDMLKKSNDLTKYQI